MGYSYNSSTYRVYNIATNVVKESTNIVFYEHNSIEIVVEYDDDLDEIEIKIPSTSNEVKNELTFTKDHLKELVIGTHSQGVVTRSMTFNENSHSAFLS